MMAALFLFAAGCNDPISDSSPGPDVGGGDDDWVAALDELFYDAGIIVPKDGSIQDAVDAAEPGSVIYVEPGQYHEDVSINKPGIRLVGLTDGEGNRVIIGGPGKGGVNLTADAADSEIINIQDDSSTQNDLRNDAAGRKGGKKTCKVSRKKVTSEIAHYVFEVRLSDRPYDIVRLHRVVKEDRPNRPVRTRGAVFMLHGASLNFESVFLYAGTDSPEPKTSISYYLASKDIDVWGLDFAWTLVPRETTDFSFMQDWGVERDADHALAGLSIARLIRGLTGQGVGRLNLLGYSYGTGVVYGAAGRETQQHPILRHIKGIIALDQLMKFEPCGETTELRTAVCATAANLKAQLEAGTYHASQGVLLATLGGLAASDPEGPSPLPPFAGFTNYQAALLVGASEAAGNVPGWHFVSGKFDDPNVPIPRGLLYTQPARWFKAIGSLPPHQPLRTTYEMRACVCDEEDVTFDDYLSEIKVPILYLGAGGGFGTYGHYSASLTSSLDITNYTVSIQPPDKRMLDFGHGDITLADNAPHLMWEPLRKWLASHNRDVFF
nr:MAG: hypothetical protein DIU61_10650 [Bacteroidota bacterium]